MSGAAGALRRAAAGSTLAIWRLATPSSGLVGVALLTAAAGAAGVDTVERTMPASDDHHWMACNAGVSLPRTVGIEPGVDAALVRTAMNEWDVAYGEVFVELPAGADRRADVEVVADSSTWVEMPCRTTHSVVHLGGRTNLAYWLTHELGHTLGLADHIRLIDDAARYINPGHCPEDGYDGVMSYCTPRERWFGPQDREMMLSLFPQLAHPATDDAGAGDGDSALPPIARAPCRRFPPELGYSG